MAVPSLAWSALACPHCGAALDRAEHGVLGCPAGHRFDLARQGYVALLGARARTDTGDSADMVAARQQFLGGGRYRRIADAVAQAVVDPVLSSAGDGGSDDRPVLELGAGTGYYLSTVLDAGPERTGIAVDSSKYAARRSAADPRVASVLADAWSRLPIRSGSAGVVLSVFAPRDPAEVARVLGSGGLLAAVTPEPGHLQEIRQALGLLTVDEGKADRLTEVFAGWLDPVHRRRVSYPMSMTRAELALLVRMGPAARHAERTTIERRVAALDELTTVTVAVSVSTFRKGQKSPARVSGRAGTTVRHPG